MCGRARPIFGRRSAVASAASEATTAAAAQDSVAEIPRFVEHLEAGADLEVGGLLAE